MRGCLTCNKTLLYWCSPCVGNAIHHHEERYSSPVQSGRFVDITTGRRFITHSTVRSPKTEVIDGVEHFVVSCGITSDSHPFFTGKNQFVDTEGRIDKFQKRFGAVRRSGGKPKLNK